MPLTRHSRDNLLWIEDHNYYRQPIPAVLTLITSSAYGRSKIKDVINFKLKRWTEALCIKKRTKQLSLPLILTGHIDLILTHNQ